MHLDISQHLNQFSECTFFNGFFFTLLKPCTLDSLAKKQRKNEMNCNETTYPAWAKPLLSQKWSENDV